MRTHYTPGERAALVGSRTVVMSSAESAAQLSVLIDQTASALEVLSVLSGGDVARLPEFAAVVCEGEDLVVLVRGDYEVAHGQEQWSGAGVATWHEHRVPNGTEEVVVRRAGTGGSGDGPRLPIMQGVVLADEVAWSPAEAEMLEPQEEQASVPFVAVVQDDGNTEDRGGVAIDHDLVPDAATRAPEPTQELAVAALPEPARAELPGDHDGRTITAAQMQQLREQEGTASSTEASRPEAILTISTGEEVELDQPVIIGRSPRASQLSSAELPRLVVIDDPYVSGTHLEVTAVDGSIVAVDHSTNGTTLTRPGQEAARLPKNEPTVLEHGCVLGLSDEITATLAVRGAGT